ncbi:MAG: hypothetical protein LBD29_08475 [Treponema sp.]|jgi:hypothetical protein|nr:hypothetical protein [Treponema sp.]
MRRNQSYTASSEELSSTTKSNKISFISGIVACLCIVVYLGSMIVAGIRVYAGIKERRNLAAKEFKEFSDLASSIGDIFFTDQALFNQTLTEAIMGSKTLQGVIVSSPRGDYAFERSQGTSIVWNQDTPPRFKARFGLSKELLVKQIELKNGDLQQAYRVSLSAVYNYVSDDLLITILKRTLMVVLVALCLALFTLIFQFILSNPMANAKEEVSVYTHKSEIHQEIFKDTFETAAESPLSPEIHPEPPASAVLTEEPREFYTSRNAIGEESRTQDRLASELKRCTSFGQDLVFMVIEIQEPEREDPEDKALQMLADEGVKFFLRRDLIFEKGARGIAVILPSIDLDQGFTKSEKFHNRVVTKYVEAFEGKVSLYMGLSSRADRTIDAERLIFEASGALKKAWEDPSSPIVAFRSDPEKYKAFIAAQNKNYP